MNFWTPRIALIAYVLGGWLLPALHQHDHSHAGHHHGAGCGGSQLEVLDLESSPNSNAEESDCGCGHSHDTAVAFQAATSSDLNFQPTHSQTDCVDLCSLCVAASMSAASIDRVVVLNNSVVHPFSVTGGSQVWPAQPLQGGVSSRGPPVVA